MRDKSITQKELLPIVIACMLWGIRSTVLAHCDNNAVVEVVNTGSCRDPELMQLLRGLFYKKHTLR